MSHSKVEWHCTQGHDWFAKIEDRSMGGNCPYCGGRRPSWERNLATISPELAKEWSPRNIKSASEIAPRARIKGLWDCAQGHHWRATVCNRARGSGCPYCLLNQTKSAPETALTNSLVVWLGQDSLALRSTMEGLRWPSGITINPDFAVVNHPIKLVVEYDGQRFHSTRAQVRTDLAKTKILNAAGFTVIRIREAPLPVLCLYADLILDSTSIYRDRAFGFPYLIHAAREHIDKIGRHTYGDMTWEKFLVDRHLTTSS